MGLQMPSTSFCLSVNSSTSASWLASSHLMISSHFLVMVSLSESLILSFSFSSSSVDFMLKQYDSKLLGADSVFLLLIFGLECFSIIDHSLNFLLRQSTFVVGDGAH